MADDEVPIQLMLKDSGKDADVYVPRLKDQHSIPPWKELEARIKRKLEIPEGKAVRLHSFTGSGRVIKTYAAVSVGSGLRIFTSVTVS